MKRTETQMKILEVGKKEFLEKGFKYPLNCYFIRNNEK